ncbi:MAG: hypothetical protein L6Q76_00110 [Polyangiaceae bacterium]|nr:hypothetical protein [Polyangiaceae bacterium]
MDLALTTIASVDNPVVHDLDLLEGQLYFVSRVDAVAQHLRQRLQFFRGEWFLNLLEGVPYYESILVKNPNLVLVRSIFRRVILTTPGISHLVEFQLVPDGATRTAALDFVAALIGTDEVLDSDNYPPLIVEVG